MVENHQDFAYVPKISFIFHVKKFAHIKRKKEHKRKCW